MKILPKNSSEDKITKFIGDFVNLLSEEKYEEAFELTYQKYDHVSPKLIKRLIESYGFDESIDGEIFRVTSLEKMESQSPEIHFYWYDSVDIDSPKEIGCVEYDLPINGKWSDLTAIFYIDELESGIALSIYDLHVL